MCRHAIVARQPSNLYRVLKSVQAEGDKRRLKSVLCCAQRKLCEHDFWVYSNATMPRRAAWANSHTICRLFLQNTSGGTLPRWGLKLSQYPLLKALLFYLRADPSIVDAIWRVDLMAEASL